MIRAADLVDGTDVGVVERSCCASLSLELAQAITIRIESGGQDFDCDVSA
jgi:hypothetical protein